MRRLCTAIAILALAGCDSSQQTGAGPAAEKPAAAKSAELPVIDATLGLAPQAAPPVNRDHPAKVIVKLEVRESREALADGVDYTFWTFGGTVPGRFIRVREGDLVEFHLKNHPTTRCRTTSTCTRSPVRAAARRVTFTAPGHQSQFTLHGAQPRALRLPLRDRAGRHAHRERHVRPDPRRAGGRAAAGRPRVLRDAERVLHDGQVRRARPAAVRHGAARSTERPDYVVFNGAIGALVGDNALHAKVGETRPPLRRQRRTRTWSSSFHVIGEIFDNVFTSRAAHESQSTTCRRR